MKLYHTHHHSRLHSIVHSDLWNFDLSVWIHMIGWSITSIFIPVLMLTVGYSLTAVLVYEAVFYLIDEPLNFLARKLVIAIGARAVIILATFCAIGYLVLFTYISIGGWAILCGLAFLAALYDTFYWVAHIYLFMESSGKKKEIGRNNGILSGIRSFGGMLGPAVGAITLIAFGQPALLVISIIFLALSIIPLLSLHHVKDKPEEKISFREFFTEWPERKNFLVQFLYSTHSIIESIIWPIFIFTLFGGMNSIALVAVVISVSKIILSYISGIITDTRRETFISVGVLLTLLVWVVRILYPSSAIYYISILLTGLCAIMVEVPVDSMVFERARSKNHTLTASTYRNTIGMLPGAIIFVVLAVVVGVFKISFGMAIVSLFVLLVINQAIVYFSKNRAKLTTA